MLIITAISGWLVNPLIYYLLVIKKKIKLGNILVFVNTSIFILYVSMAVYNKWWKPGVFVYAQRNSWYEVQLWVKDNTKFDSIFITPVDKWSHYMSDFIVLSQRSTVVSLGELFEVAFHPQYIRIWEERFEDVVPGAVAMFTPNFEDNRRMVSIIYNQNTEDDFIRIARKYNASYVIVEKPKVLTFNKVFDNYDFTIYSIADEL